MLIFPGLIKTQRPYFDRFPNKKKRDIIKLDVII